MLGNGARVILDAGTGLRALGMRMRRDAVKKPDRTVVPVILSHRHMDHVIGLAHFMPLIADTHRVRIACHEVDAIALHALVSQQLSEPLFPSIDGVAEVVDVVGFSAQDALSLGSGCRVRALPANHPGGAAVLCVDDANGPVLAYAPDNELSEQAGDGGLVVWRRALASALRGTPMLLHDATFVDAELAAHRGWGHSSAEEATRFAMECEVGTLVLMHHHPDRTDNEIDEILSRCQDMVVRAGSSMRVVAAGDGSEYLI